MGISKSNGITETAPAPMARTLNTELVAEPKKAYQGRDFEAEARGKVACAAFGAALASPGLAGLGYTNYDEFLVHVRKAAEEMVRFTWDH